MLSVGSILSGAFRLVRERFGSVMLWGFFYSLGALAAGYMMMPSMLPPADDADPAATFSAAGSFLGRMVLVQLGFLCFYTILVTAAQRAVLRPEESDFASLRFGADELRMIGLALILAFLFLVGYLIAAFAIGIVAIAMGPDDNSLALIAVIGMLVFLCLALFFWVRVSLAFPLTLLRGRIALGEGWRLSRGRFWTLFGGYIILVLIVVALMFVTGLVLQGSYWSQLMSGGVGAPEMQQAAQAQMEAQYSLGLPMIMNLAAGTVIGGLGIAFTAGATASAALDLAVDHQGIAETFA